MPGNDTGFRKGGVILLRQEKRAPFTFLYVLGSALWELPQLSDARTCPPTLMLALKPSFLQRLFLCGGYYTVIEGIVNGFSGFPRFSCNFIRIR